MRTCDLLKFAVAYHGSLCPLFVWTRRGKKRSANCSEMSTPKDFRVVSTALAHYCGILVCAMLICATEWRLYKLQLYNCAAKSSKIVIIVIVPDFDWVRINGDYRIWERVKVKKNNLQKQTKTTKNGEIFRFNAKCFQVHLCPGYMNSYYEWWMHAQDVSNLHSSFSATFRIIRWRCFHFIFFINDNNISAEKEMNAATANNNSEDRLWCRFKSFLTCSQHLNQPDRQIYTSLHHVHTHFWFVVIFHTF